MSQTQISQTSIPVSVVTLAAAQGIKMDATDVEKIYRSIVASMSTFLFDKKDKAAKTVIRVQDSKGPLLLAGIVEYHPGAEEDMPGNWSYVLTDKEEDCADCQNDYDISDLSFNSVAIHCTARYGDLQFDDFVWLHRIFVIATTVLHAWLDENAVEGEVVTVECPGFFEASVAIEGKEKVFSYVPDGQMKKKIKGDLDIEK